jgi:hypothetical protein
MEEGLATDFELTKRKRLRLSKSLLLRMRGILLSNVRRRMIAFGSLEVMGDGDHTKANRGDGSRFPTLIVTFVEKLG